jgi:hypothetical protein
LNILIYIKRLLPFFFAILLIPEILVTSGCANIIPPTGGPRDSLPPRVMKVEPPDSSAGFKSKTIIFTFDEYIDPQLDLVQNLLISPTPEKQPAVEVKLKTFIVKIKDTLEPNTTYFFNFGKAIKDVNEGNVLPNLSYIFTTGTAIDSLELTGIVRLAETGGTDSSLIVMLHRRGDDSAVVKERPRYVTRLDGGGNFRFRFLPAGTYYIYALKDEGGSRRYFGGAQLFAFADSAVEVKPEAPPVTLYAYADKKETTTAPLISFTGGRSPGAKADDRRLKFGTSLSAGVQDLLTGFSLNFEQPLRSLDTLKMQLSTDSSFKPETNYYWTIDSLKKKLTLQLAWKENTLYHLILDKEFAEDSAGRKLLKTDTLSFTTRKKADYGSVKLNFINLDVSKNPVLQFLQGSQVIKSYPLAAPEFFQPLFLPGEYDLSILFDNNKNGRWDPGEFFGKRKQPEIVKPLSKKISVKADWENEYEIQ